MQPNPTDTPLTFSSLSLAEPLLMAVRKLGFEQPTPVQQQAIPPALEHKDLLVSAETGSGKTAAFLLPTLHHLLTLSTRKPGTRALILAPTRELAQQIFKQCQQLIEFTDLKVGIITGGDDFRLQQNMLRRNTEIVIATPGRILELMEQEIPNFTNLEILILDEADRMLDMGFSEDVLTITKSCNTQRQTLLFSATLTHFGVIKMADKILQDHKVVALNTLHDGHRNIEQQIIVADDNDHKQKLLAWLLLNETYDKALVFTNSRIQADLLRGPLRGQKLRVGVLHGEMDQKDRNRMMQLFREGEVKVMVATDLAARGLDIKGINLVINFDVPRNGINYIHRIGRTGRVDELGLTIALVKST
jgi:ATP-dependent RNA helicase SrmB